MHRFKWLIACIIIAGASLLMTDTAYAQARGRLNGNHVRVRSSATLDTNENILFQVSRGEQVDVLGTEGEFYRVNVRDYGDVFIFREFIDIVETVGTPEVSEILVKAAPDASSEEVIGITNGEAELEVTGRYGAWYQVFFNGGHGFVESHKLDVKLSDSLATVRPPRVGGGELIDDILDYAKSYIGVPYRFGSTDPARGFDCSGFVTVVMRNFGIYLQRSSAAMASTNGSQVARNALEPGDLVFFATGGGGRVSHVGIYIGDDRFIHSASCRGVIISGMEDPGYRGRFVRANRVL